MTSAPLRIEVRSGGRSTDYEVWVEVGASDRLGEWVERLAPAHRVVVVSDANVAALHGDRVRSSLGSAELLTFPAGESSKSVAQWSTLIDALAAGGYGRDTILVALGGGVTGDLAGFVAASYLRGLPLIQVPTTLLAMIDSSVGGKTGLNLAVGKNLVGAFHPPALVVVDPGFTATLSRGERATGLAEAVKHAALSDVSYLDALEEGASALLAGDPVVTAALVAPSIRIKADVVAADERESGRRQILNLGHTIAHAIEATSRYSVSHGHAVAMGMVVEARAGEAAGITESGTAERIEGVLHALELPTRMPEGMDAERVLSATLLDKKGRGGRARYVLLRRPGTVATEGGWSVELPPEVVLEALELRKRVRGA